MTCQVLRYAAPMMAFGHTARFDDRPTAATPTMSAVQGMLASAAGLPRGERWPSWLAQVHMAIRIDHAGRLMEDYHTVNKAPTDRYLALSERDQATVRVIADAEGHNKHSTVVSRRGYLSDATFLLFIDDPTGDVEAALANPQWHLYAGRKSCPLTSPLVLGGLEVPSATALGQVATVAHPTEKPSEVVTTRHTVLFSDPGGPTATEDRFDRALGFRQHERQRRWHGQVTVPLAQNWFDVHDDLTGGSNS